MGDLHRLSDDDDRPAERTVRLNEALAWMFASGHAADLILLILAIELPLLVGARRWRAVDAMLALGPGALMILALRQALTGAPWPQIALPLALSFPVHLADLRRRGGRHII